MAYPFRVNLQADRAHRSALKTSGFNPSNAIPLFDAAFEVLASVDHPPYDLSFKVQKARIERDAAFTRARVGIEEAQPDLVHGAYIATECAFKTLTAVADEIPPTAGRLAAGNPEEYLSAERGVCLTHMARLASLYGLLEYPDGEAHKPLGEDGDTSQRGYFDLAASAFMNATPLLAQGNNAYYRASNHANNARFNRMLGGVGNGKVAKLKMGQAFDAVRDAATSDRRNLIHAARTTTRLVIASRTPSSAYESILAHP